MLFPRVSTETEIVGSMIRTWLAVFIFYDDNLQRQGGLMFPFGSGRINKK